MKNKYGIVSLKELSKQPDVFIKITKKMKNELNDKRKKRFKNLKELSKHIHEKESTLISFFWQETSLSLKIFLKIVKILKIKNYENKILWIGGRTRGKGIKNPKLLFNFNNEEGGKFIASVLGDGTFNHKFEIQYTNHCPILLENIIKTAKNVFGNIDIIYKSEKMVLFPTIAGKIIKELGLKQGRKTVTNPHIPKFILNGSRKCKIGYLKQISDDEGSPQINPPYSYSIRYEFALEIPKNKLNEREKYIPNLLLDLYELVRSLGYTTTAIYGGRVFCGRKNKDRRIVSWAFNTVGKKNIEKFAKEINFRTPKRRKKLETGLKKMKIETYGKKAKFIILEKCKELSSEKTIFTKYDLMKKINRSRRNSEEWLKKLEKKKFVKIIEGNKFIIKSQGFCGLAGRTAFKYKITKSGLEFLNKNNKDEIQIKILPKYKNIKEPIDNWQ